MHIQTNKLSVPFAAHKEFLAYERWENCYGEVIGKCKAGVYLRLDNGQEAFAFNFLSLPYGSRALCSVLKPATDTKDILVVIDSIISHAPIVS